MVKIGFLHRLVMNNSAREAIRLTWRATQDTDVLTESRHKEGEQRTKRQEEHGGGGEETTNNLCQRKRSVKELCMVCLCIHMDRIKASGFAMKSLTASQSHCSTLV